MSSKKPVERLTEEETKAVPRGKTGFAFVLHKLITKEDP